MLIKSRAKLEVALDLLAQVEDDLQKLCCELPLTREYDKAHGLIESVCEPLEQACALTRKASSYLPKIALEVDG